MRSRWTALFLVIAAVAFWWVAYFMPFWRVTVWAPQYPQGLHLSVYLHRIEGDVWEINLLNQYIGIAPVEQAALLERRFAWLFPIVLTLAAVVFWVGYRWRLIRWVFVLGAWGFAVGFLGDLYYWLYRYGHDLDPHAPIRIQPFTLPLLGSGEIMQFRSWSRLDVGFYLIVAAALCVTIAIRFLSQSGQKSSFRKEEVSTWAWQRSPLSSG